MTKLPGFTYRTWDALTARHARHNEVSVVYTARDLVDDIDWVLEREASDSHKLRAIIRLVALARGARK